MRRIVHRVAGTVGDAAVIAPFGSSALSSTVATVSVAVPPAPMVTVREPVWSPLAKAPLSVTMTVTVMSLVGAGSAVNVKVASVPSVTGDPLATMRATGVSDMNSIYNAALSYW